MRASLPTFSPTLDHKQWFHLSTSFPPFQSTHHKWKWVKKVQSSPSPPTSFHTHSVLSSKNDSLPTPNSSHSSGSCYSHPLPSPASRHNPPASKSSKSFPRFSCRTRQPPSTCQPPAFMDIDSTSKPFNTPPPPPPPSPPLKPDHNPLSHPVSSMNSDPLPNGGPILNGHPVLVTNPINPALNVNPLNNLLPHLGLDPIIDTPSSSVFSSSLRQPDLVLPPTQTSFQLIFLQLKQPTTLGTGTIRLWVISLDQCQMSTASNNWNLSLH